MFKILNMLCIDRISLTYANRFTKYFVSTITDFENFKPFFIEYDPHYSSQNGSRTLER